MLVVTFFLTAYYIDVYVEELLQAFPKPICVIFQPSQGVPPTNVFTVKAEVGVDAVLYWSPCAERHVQNREPLQYLALGFNKLHAGVILELLEVLFSVCNDGLLMTSLLVVIIVLLAVTFAHFEISESRNIASELV